MDRMVYFGGDSSVRIESTGRGAGRVRAKREIVARINGTER